MTWETLAWRPADAETVPGTATLIDLVAIARSATDEAVSAVVMQPITTSGLSVTSVAWGDLPAGFMPATTFELLGTPRRAVWVALDPAMGSRLAGADVTAIGLAAPILEALDMVLVEVVGEGLSTAPSDETKLDAAAEMVLLRLTLRGPDGTEVAIVTAVEARVPVELATHVAALQALGPSPARAPSPDPKPVAMGAVDAPDPGSVAHAAPASQARPSAAPAGATRESAPATTVRPFVLDELPPVQVAPATQNIELLMGVNLQVTVEIGRTRLAIRDVLSLTPGSIVELDKLAGEKVDVLVNGQQIAQGEVVVVDENFGVRITDVVSPQRRILSADSAA